jgi:molybdopterin/thiamine biosynthesis adenylyltransferase
MTEQDSNGTNVESVAVIGAGGVIGSHLVRHLGRMKAINKVILVDPDSYESSNLANQDITTEDTGKRKVDVQARQLQKINPELPVVPIASAVRDVPRGALRTDVVLTCLDSRRARQDVNTIAWHLGVPWIDSGVEGGSMLARINTYFPAEDRPCLECSWGDADYRTIEQEYPCGGGGTTAYPTGAPSSLGALAAALQAVELMDLLSGRRKTTDLGRQVVIDASHHKVLVSEYRRNPGCRLQDHATWEIERLEFEPTEISIEDCLFLGPLDARSQADHGLRVEGSSFVRRLTCPLCGAHRQLMRLEASLGLEETRCDGCGGTMVAAGFDKIERIGPATTPDLSAARSLASIGIRQGEIVSIGIPGNETHIEIGGMRGRVH